MSDTINSEDRPIIGQDLNMGQRVVAFISVFIVYFFYCYNFMVGTFVRPTMVSDFGFTLDQAATIFAGLSFGTIPGTILAGICATRFGKKNALMGIAVLFASMTLLPLFAPTNYMLWRVARFVTGFALGGVFGTAVPLVSEIFPQKYRGKLAAMLTSTFSIAMIFSGILYGALGDANWRGLIWTAAIPPLLGVVMIKFFVPSDTEHMRKLRAEAKEKKESINYLNMYKGKYLFIGLGAILLSGANFVGYSGFSNNATTYLTKELGITALIAGGIYSVQGTGQLIGYNLWGFISDRFGRKKPAFGMLLCSLFVFLYMRLGVDQVAIYYVVSFMLGLSFGFSGAWGAYYTELFPLKYRSLSAGISFNGGRIVSTFALPMIASVAVSSGTIQNVFYIVIGVFIAGTVLWLALPETIEKKSADKTVGQTPAEAG